MHLENAPSPMLTILEGIKIFVSAVQPENAPSSISVVSSRIFISVSKVQSLKASFPMRTTLYPSIIPGSVQSFTCTAGSHATIVKLSSMAYVNAPFVTSILDAFSSAPTGSNSILTSISASINDTAFFMLIPFLKKA